VFANNPGDPSACAFSATVWSVDWMLVSWLLRA
jgi:hypothetical protein